MVRNERVQQIEVELNEIITVERRGVDYDINSDFNHLKHTTPSNRAEKRSSC